MTRVRIYQPSKTAMQSGRAKTSRWILEFEPQAPLTPNPLMGWPSSQDMNQELRLFFSTLPEALSFAQKRGFQYVVSSPTKRNTVPKSYGSNFTNPRIRNV